MARAAGSEAAAKRASASGGRAATALAGDVGRGDIAARGGRRSSDSGECKWPCHHDGGLLTRGHLTMVRSPSHGIPSPQVRAATARERTPDTGTSRSNGSNEARAPAPRPRWTRDSGRRVGARRASCSAGSKQARPGEGTRTMVAVREHGLASAPTATATVAIRLVLLASLIHTAAASRALVNYGGGGAGTGEMTQCEGDCGSDSPET